MATLRKARTLAALPPLDHLVVLSDDVGVIQHAIETVPARSTGYCTDDVARGLIVALAHQRLAPNDRTSARLAGIYLAYLAHAQLEDGRFHNFMDYDRRWLDEVGTQDSCGRALWALGYALANAPTPAWRSLCAQLLDRALPSLESLEYLRSRAYAALGLAYAFVATQEPRYAAPLRRLADRLQGAFDACATADWPWFEAILTYDNARLPEALIRAAAALNEPQYGKTGLQALAFYEDLSTENGIHVPIGNAGWYARGAERARYAQQPLEACAMVGAQLAAFDFTGEPSHLAAAERAMEWYYGKNSRGAVMTQGGGCYDGLEEDSVNSNMGAESTLAFLAAAYALAGRSARVLRAVR